MKDYTTRTASRSFLRLQFKIGEKKSASCGNMPQSIQRSMHWTKIFATTTTLHSVSPGSLPLWLCSSLQKYAPPNRILLQRRLAAFFTLLVTRYGTVLVAGRYRRQEIFDIRSCGFVWTHGSSAIYTGYPVYPRYRIVLACYDTGWRDEVGF